MIELEGDFHPEEGEIAGGLSYQHRATAVEVSTPEPLHGYVARAEKLGGAVPHL